MDGPPSTVYAYPEPEGYGEVRLATRQASYDEDLGQFILPYDELRRAGNPDELLLGFLQETYEAAADLAQWDRRALERSPTVSVLPEVSGGGTRGEAAGRRRS